MKEIETTINCGNWFSSRGSYVSVCPRCAEKYWEEQRKERSKK